MQIGAIYPQFELGGDPEAVDLFGRAVERLGFDHIVSYDHVLGSPHDREPPLHGPYTDEHTFHDPFVLFGYLAGVTKRIGFATGILILPQRQTALVARQASDVQILSRGRLRLGVGLGWNYVEYQSLGADFKNRRHRIGEQTELLRALWSEPLVTFEGQYDRIDRANINPRPNVPIPIWMGGGSPGAYQRAARYADGFIFGGMTRDVVLDELGKLRAIVGEQRDVDSFGVEWLLGGDTAAGIAEDFDVWASSGGTKASVRTTGMGLRGIHEHLEVLEDVCSRLQHAGLMAPAAG